MSGGSYDYVCWKIESLEQDIQNQEKDPRRAAFAKLMGLVGKAMHDIEWVDSCDFAPGDEHASIDAVFAFLKADHEGVSMSAPLYGKAGREAVSSPLERKL